MVGAESFPLSPASVLVSAEQGPASLRGRWYPFGQAREKEVYFLGERKAKRKEWFPPGQRETPPIPSEALQSPPPLPYSTLVSFWASSVGIRETVEKPQRRPRHPMSSSVSLAKVRYPEAAWASRTGTVSSWAWPSSTSRHRAPSIWTTIWTPQPSPWIFQALKRRLRSTGQDPSAPLQDPEEMSFLAPLCASIPYEGNQVPTDVMLR